MKALRFPKQRKGPFQALMCPTRTPKFVLSTPCLLKGFWVENLITYNYHLVFCKIGTLFERPNKVGCSILGPIGAAISGNPRLMLGSLFGVAGVLAYQNPLNPKPPTLNPVCFGIHWQVAYGAR